eukprot:PhM_4_TR633/c0_g1_i1/m.96515/K06179/rluC; 23S rRNA pseudouridine955/2504/2580 synthase
MDVPEGQPAPHHRVDERWIGERVDSFLQHHYPSWSKEMIYNLVRSGHIYRMKAHTGKRSFGSVSSRLEKNDILVLPPTLPPGYEKMIPSPVEIETDEPRTKLSKKVRETAESWVLYKNEHVIVLNKPTGVPVHQTKDIGINIQDMLSCWRYTYDRNPVLCHYLDAETSGCLVLARTVNAQRMLHHMFTRRFAPNNVFWAMLTSTPKANVGRVRMHMEVERGDGPNAERIIVRPKPSEKSRVATAEFTVNEKLAEYGCWISFYPLTDRRHQLRIMSAHALRAPIMGDGRYGGNAAFPEALKSFWDPHDKGIALHLHHRRIQLPYRTSTGLYVCVDAPLPHHMAKTWDALAWDKDAADPFVRA